MTEPASAPLRPTPVPVSLPQLPGLAGVAVSGVTVSSLSVAPGDLYVALPGRTTHGARFAAQAVRSGAVAVLTDPAGAEQLGGLGVPVAVVAEPRVVMAEVAARVYRHPADRLLTYALTGTNGKTTTLYLLAAALRAAGHRVGTIGTIGARVDDEELPLARTTVTTPEAPDVQALLAVMVERGATALVMEVSSHALAMHRVAGIRYDVAGFTNLGWDHRDFHPTQEDYFQAKARLFTPQQTSAAVIAVDDDWGERLVEQAAQAGLRLLTTGERGQYRSLAAEPGPDGSQQVRVTTPDGERGYRLGLPGAHNVANSVTAVAMLAATGASLEQALPGLATVTVPGRMQRVPLPGPAPRVYVDFAHTPQAVAATLEALGSVRTVCVLGAGGDRDQGKRGPMGAVAAQACDVLVVTDDNPRSEPPEQIRAAVLAGARQARDEAAPGSRAAGCQVIDGGDRRQAIRQALALAGPGDVVAVLGKGHEQGQAARGTVTPFSDAAVVAEEWDALAGSEETAWK
ncbi:MAG: UDP-N-acetylmuramoyl-L-alanyl-D-glutamate--2,6-diaminopimelate ligase [Actinomycetia bacterium]|nr:UDP-N-acetylmuramoyl-L-alanyl-D-glutamate--2,6-diaminopimelate ligase [Actinomycetes bacterium]